MSYRSFSSLRVRLLLTVMLSVIPMLGRILHLGIRERARGVSQAQATALEMARSISRFQECVIHDTHQFLLTLSRLPQLQQPDSRSCSALLTYLLQQVHSHAEVAAAKADGTVFASWPTMRKDRLLAADLDWYRRLVRTNHLVIGGYQAEGSDACSISVAQPLLDPEAD